VNNRILSELAEVVKVHYGAIYIVQSEELGQKPKLKLSAAYAYNDDNVAQGEFYFGEGLVGQCAFEKERILLTNVPRSYVKVSSGLGRATPANLVIMPVLFENNVKAVISWRRLRYSAKRTLTSSVS